MKYKKLGDSLYIKGRIGWKGLKKKEYLDRGNYRIISGKNLIDGNVFWEDVGYISSDRYNESPEIMLRQGDILMTRDGTIGKVAIVKVLDMPTTIASGLLLIRNNHPEIWDTKFLFYFFSSNEFQEYIKSREEGSAIPHLYQRHLEDLSIPYFPLKKQKYVSQLLDLFSKKIELNNRINNNLFPQNYLFKRSSNNYYWDRGLIFSF